MVRLITSNNEYTAINLAIEGLENYSKTENIFVVVPDRASLLCEIEIINTLNEEGYFNIEVITLDTLCVKLNEEAGDNTQKLSSFALVGVIKSLLNKNHEKLTCFKKASSNVGFAESLYSTILQIKSSGIKPKELINDIEKLPTGLKQKLSDISLIYEEYENFLIDISDDLSKFSMATQNIITSNFIKNSHFMFLHQNSFTFWGEEILKGLIKYSKSITVACTNKTNGLNEVYNIMQKLCEEVCIKPEVINKDIIVENEIKLYKAKTIRDEVLNAALNIKQLLKQGETTDNISLAVCGLSGYEWEIKTTFESLGINCFLDLKTSLINFAISKFVLAILNVLAYDFNQEDVLNLSKNFYFGLSFNECSEFENEVLKKGKTGAMFFDFSRLKPIFEEYENFKKSNTLNEYSAVLLKILKKFDIDNKTAELEDKISGSLLGAKRCIEIIEEFSVISGNFEVKYDEFIKILEASFVGTEILIAPLKTNTVFVGDIKESFFAKSRHLFILGANDGAFPEVKQDTGLLLDSDINEISVKNKIQPSIKLVNKRADEKCKNILQLAEHVYLSYSALSFRGEAEASIIYSNLLKITNEEVITFEDIYKFEGLKNFVISRDFLKSIFYNNYTNFLNFKKEDEKFLANLTEIFKEDELLKYLHESFSIDNSKKLFFETSKASITEIEQYFNCPLKHFYNNGLKLKEQEKAKLQSFDVGNIYHEFLKELEIYLLKNNDITITKVLKEAEIIKEKIIKSEKYKEQLLLKENVLIKKVIDEEIPQVAKNLYYHHINSEFKPKRDDKGLFTLEYKTESKIDDIDLIGKIDRIDYYNNSFRVIDYKTTSNGKPFSYQSFVYGLSLQLLVYSTILKQGQEKDKTLAGAFYYPVKIKGDSEFNAKLNGLILTDLELINKMDLTYNGGGYSKMLPVALTTEGKAYSGGAGSKMLSEKQLNCIVEYSKNIISSAITEILTGKTKPSVLSGEETCKYCPFFKIGKCSNATVRKKEKYDKTSFDDEVDICLDDEKVKCDSVQNSELSFGGENE